MGDMSQFFTDTFNIVQIIIWTVAGFVSLMGVVQLVDGFQHENPSAKSQGGKALAAGFGLVLIGTFLVPSLQSVIMGLSM